jgi:CubicO group peptidase (beta-lactamase class C family)
MSKVDAGAARAAADAAVAPWRAENGPGGAILLFDRERILAETCGGLADLAHGLAFTPDTANRWASITKHVFAALAVKRGLSLAATLGTLLPGTSPAVGSVTAGRALDMTSGLPDLAEYFGGLGVGYATPMRREALEALARTLPALNYPQGSEISYTNTGYRLLQAALERNAAPLAEQWREEYFEPLALDISFPFDFSEPVPHLATGYWRDAAGWHAGQYGAHVSASGGLVGSARTLARWLMALLRDDAPVSGVLDRIAASRSFSDGRETGYGLGIAQRGGFGQPCFGHGGSHPGYKDHFLVAPGAGVGVVVVANREDIDPLGIAMEVMAAWLGASLPPPAPDALPEGLFADPQGSPFWIEHAAGRLGFLGAEEKLVQAPDGSAASRSPYMAMRLARDGDGIAGEINGVARRFTPVPEGLPPDRAWAGHWRNDEHGAEATVKIADGVAQLTLGIPPADVTMQLRPIGLGRALGDVFDGPWRRRPCFAFSGDRMRVVTNRARVLEYARAG